MSSTIPVLLSILLFQVALCQRNRLTHYSPCDQSSCYPATGDLLVGRESRLTATSTCGINRPERYCIVSHLEDQNNKCFVCDSRQPFGPYNKMSHRVENIVSTFKKDWRLRWWQAQNGHQTASIQLDLEAEFHFTHLIMRFKTFRPASMLIERSYDFGKTWKVYRYFAFDCAESFPSVSTSPIRQIQDVICESRYSDVAPSTEGEVIFRVLPVNVEIQDPYSEQVQDLLKMTNLRVNFTKLHTLGDNLLDSRAEIKEKYYYSVYNMVVRGSCSCYGHASRCLPLPGQEDNANMVHGRCECTHNTKGLNCEQCDDFYNDLPWRPARGRDTNACKKCDCNNHSTKCHFDPAVYEATGRVSGGVCDDCRDNTMGHHCEECKPFFYQDPGRDITDPYVCRQCDCDPIGSEHGGECESRTDPSNDLIAGRCICKRNVEGRRCDSCKDGFWNMKTENPDGCEPCGCYALGSVGNYGCDKYSGECRCKRYVTGRQCDQCLPGYWNLGDEPQGCHACDCDVGGSYDYNCDQATGQCKCRPNAVGQRCNQVRPGFFVATLDWQRYEAEFAKGIGNTHVVVREPIAGRPTTWTGTGFMRVYEGSSIEFLVDDISWSMDYDLIIRYEPQMPLRWDDVRIRVIRPGPIDQRGACANTIPQDDLKTIKLSQSSRQMLVTPSVCLEKGVTYTIRLEFVRYRADGLSPEGTVLVDAIVLMPSTSGGHPLMQPGDPRNIKDDFERYRCRDHYMSVPSSPLSEYCKELLFSSSISIYDGAFACDCDPTGSESSSCELFGGQCPCKPNVMGRRCDQCFPGTYGFGPAGCTPCECNHLGSTDLFCDIRTGQCNCVPNAYGRQCGNCQRGFYGFPNCRPCQCSGRADECDSDSGQCLYCRDFTGGHNCERCADGYYGDPRPGSAAEGCRPCMCPGGQGSGFQHGDTCRLDTRTGHVLCDCRHGYAGINCDRCAENFFGNPLVPGGKCEQCTCNNNIDHNHPGSCDSATGECLRCLYNTEGFGCEHCRQGYYGDATQQSCRACVCNILGTYRTEYHNCDRVSGQCRCLPHVTGLQCDTCEPDHWKLASGNGCEACACDPRGSTSSQCHEFDGQCNCVPGRGGRDCSECEDLFWGDPEVGCKPCDCNRQGSTSLQCNRRTGQCECAVGVAGHKCDRCDRGTTGTLPYCVPCGECFDNWDRIINELRNETTELIELGSEIKIGGAPGFFDKEFKEMEEKLDDVRRILAGTNVSEEGLQDLMNRLAHIRKNLTDSSDEINTVDNDVRQTTDRVETINNRIEKIKARVDSLKKAAEELKANATIVQEMDVSGAFNSIRESYNRSEFSQAKVDSTTRVLDESEDTRNQVDALIDAHQDNFNEQLGENDGLINDLNATLNEVNGKIVDLNEIVCDGRGDPCDGSCGGAGCGKCGGGISCQDGSVSKSLSAMDFSKRAETILLEKQREADSQLDEVHSAREICDVAANTADMAHERAERAKNESESNVHDLQRLIEAISEFLAQRGARPFEIRTVAEEVLSMTISLTPEQILDLAKQINDTIQSLTNIDAIINATKDDLERVMELKRQADSTKDSADNVLSTAQRVTDLLKSATKAQDAADKDISQARLEIEVTETDLETIEKQTNETTRQSENLLTRVHDLRNRIAALKQKFAENEVNVQRASEEAERAEKLANKAEMDASELEVKYSNASHQLEMKINETRVAKERADQLKERASVMYQSVYSKLRALEEMEEFFNTQELNLKSISGDINKMNLNMLLYLQDIADVAKYHRTCSQ